MQIEVEVHKMPYGMELIKGVETRIRANCCTSYHSNPIAIREQWNCNANLIAIQYFTNKPTTIKVYCRLPARLYVEFVIHSIHHNYIVAKTFCPVWKIKQKVEEKWVCRNFSRVLYFTIHSIQSNYCHSNALGVVCLVAPLFIAFGVHLIDCVPVRKTTNIDISLSISLSLPPIRSILFESNYLQMDFCDSVCAREVIVPFCPYPTN